MHLSGQPALPFYRLAIQPTERHAMSDPNTRIPTLADLGNSGFMGARPNPSPHMSGHVPPAPSPFAAQPSSTSIATGPSWRAHADVAAPVHSPVPRVPSTLRERMTSFAIAGAALCALYAWLGVHGAGVVIAAYAIAGAGVGAVAAVVLAILAKLLELAIKLFIICMQIAFAGVVIYALVRWFGH